MPPKTNPRTPGTKYRDKDGSIKTYRTPAQSSFGSNIRRGAQGTILENYLPGVNDSITGTTPPPSLFQPINPDQFRGQAEEESNPFFNKDLSLALKNLDLARKQHTDAKQLAEKFQGQEEAQQGRMQDRGFAQAIQGAQNGYAVRNTAGSGMANRGFENLLNNQNEQNIKTQRQFASATESRDLGFSQFIDQTNLREEEARLSNERGRQTEILGRQIQLTNQSTGQQNAAKGLYKSLADFYLPTKLAG